MSVKEREISVLKLRGLPFCIKEADVVSFLYGVRLNEVHLLYKPNGQPSGEAFVVVDNENDAQLVMAHNGEFIGRRFIETYMSCKEEMMWCLKRSCKPDGTLRLVGLPYDVDKLQVADFFKGFEIVPNGIGLLTDQHGRPTGEAFVQFASPKVADFAMSKHKERIGGRYVEIYPSSLKAAMKSIERQMYTNMGTNPDTIKRHGSSWINPYWLSKPPMDSTAISPTTTQITPSQLCALPTNPTFTAESDQLGGRPFVVAVLEAAGFVSPVLNNYYPQSVHFLQNVTDQTTLGQDAQSRPSSSRCRIRMRGLPYSATIDDVIAFFAPTQPLKICLRSHKDGKPNGTADVQFVSEEDTREAMQRHKALMGSRYIELFSSVKPSPSQ